MLDVFEIIVPPVDDQDVEAEQALLALLGKRTHRNIIRMKMAEKQEYAYGEEVPFNATPAFTSPKPTFDQIDQICTWIEGLPENQKQIVEPVMNWWWEDPETRLRELLLFLVKNGIVSPENAGLALKNQPDNFAELLRRQFRKYKTLTYLYLKQIQKNYLYDKERENETLMSDLRMMLTAGEIGYEWDGEGGVYTWLGP